jgi:SAM-dependent methyltransferase
MVELGPDIDHEHFARLLSNVAGKRVLELGCGNGASAVALSLAGAKVISVDPSADQLTRARRAADEHGVRVEYHQGDLADLAFVRADTIDACLAVYSLAEVDEVARVFRQVHRVLKRDSIFLISLPHPVAHMTKIGNDAVPYLSAPYPPKSPAIWQHAGRERTSRIYAIGDMFMTLTRCNFRVDGLIEPMPNAAAADHSAGAHAHEARGWVPETVIYRARKVGQ